MGTLFVVVSQPGIGLRLNLIDRIEQTRIEHLGKHPPNPTLKSP